MRTRLLLLLVASGLAHAAPPPPRPAAGPLMTELMARLAKAGDCPTSNRVWCVATENWDKATPADLPRSGVLAGITIGLEQGKKDSELLQSEVSLSALGVKDGKGLITDIPPTNAAEKRTIATAIGALAKELKTGEHAALAAPLLRYLKTVPGGAAYPLTKEAGSWHMTGKAEAFVRKIPSGGWIAVEIPSEGPIGIFVSIYPDAWIAP